MLSALQMFSGELSHRLLAFSGWLQESTWGGCGAHRAKRDHGRAPGGNAFCDIAIFSNPCEPGDVPSVREVSDGLPFGHIQRAAADQQQVQPRRRGPSFNVSHFAGL